MPTPMTPDAFIARGVPADQAKAFAEQHNSIAGIRVPESSVQPAPVTAPAPKSAATPTAPSGMTPEAARAEIDALRARRASGEMLDWEWRTKAEPRILELAGLTEPLRALRADPVARAVESAEFEASQVQDAMATSVDSGMKPASSPADYVFPEHDGSPEGAEVDRQFREAMHGAGLPREMGNSIAADVDATARALLDATEAQTDAFMAEQDRTLKRMFGAQYDARVANVREFLREQGERSPALRVLLEQHPELLSGWRTVFALAQLTESRRRTGGARR